MTDLDPTLLPCPFCGSTELLPTWDEWQNGIVVCLNCQCAGPPAPTRAQAVQEWNKRPGNRGER